MKSWPSSAAHSAAHRSQERVAAEAGTLQLWLRMECAAAQRMASRHGSKQANRCAVLPSTAQPPTPLTVRLAGVGRVLAAAEEALLACGHQVVGVNLRGEEG